MRRGYIIAGAALAAFSASAALPAGHTAPAQAILGTPQQDAAESLVLEILAHPEIRAIQALLREQLLATEIGRTRDGAATAARAVDCLTMSLLFHVVSAKQHEPYFVWGTEDTPRNWRGRSVPCTGTAGDNPDNIYRSTMLEGAVRYEIAGRLDPARRTTQFILQLGTGESSIAPNMAAAGSEVVQVLGAFDDQQMQIAPDGTFRITIGGESGAATHVKTPPGPISIGFRDSMADWSQRPAQLTVRRLDPGSAPVWSKDEIRRLAVGRLGDYVRNWSQFATYGFGGGLGPNTHSPPVGRAGGWGFVMGVRYRLGEGEAAVVRISKGAARYLGFQVVDPWTIASDASRYQTSLNLTQARPDRDGNYTFVISPSGPGVANWLDTTGLRDGFGIVRWQAVPKDMTNAGLMRGFRVVKLGEIAKLRGVVRVTPAQRARQLQKRKADWELRLR